MIRAGELRYIVELQERSTVQDTAGEPLNTWTTFATRRAALVRTPGKEVFASAQRAGRVPVLFRMRYLEGVEPGMRLLFEDRIHDILSATDPDGRGEELVIAAEEHVGDLA